MGHERVQVRGERVVRVPGVTRLWRLVTAGRKVTPGDRPTRATRYGVGVVTLPPAIRSQFVTCCSCQTRVRQDYGLGCEIHQGGLVCFDCIATDAWC